MSRSPSVKTMTAPYKINNPDLQLLDESRCLIHKESSYFWCWPLSQVNIPSLLVNNTLFRSDPLRCKTQAQFLYE